MVSPSGFGTPPKQETHPLRSPSQELTFVYSTTSNGLNYMASQYKAFARRLVKSSKDRPTNIGNPIEYVLREVTQMVVETSGGESELVYEPLPKGGNPKRRCPQGSRVKEVLGWVGAPPRSRGLRRTLDWFARRLDSSQRAATTTR